MDLEYDQIVDQLEKEIHKGQKRALRDLGSLLDKKEVSQKIRDILSRNTFFTSSEIEVNQSSKVDFLSFYYDYEQKIQFSELLHVFYITPLENRKISFEMRPVSTEDASNNSGVLRHYFLELNELLSFNQFEEASSLVEKIAPIQATNKDQLLINLLKNERLLEIPIPLRNNFYKNLLNQFSEYPEIELVEIILQLTEGGFLDDKFATPLLVKITNCQVPFQSPFENSINYYQKLVDSLETLEEIRRYGYDQIFKFKINFFQFPVDYYGKIIGLSAPYPWIRYNATIDLKQSDHPRALFYIAADFYRTRNNTEDITDSLHLQLIKSRTNVEIGIKDRNGNITFHPERNDETAMLNYLIYWAVAYQDYEWDENRRLFTSKMESFAKTQNYERLFRRFNSKNDSIAILSFLQLTEGDPMEVIPLAKKYRDLLRNHNKSIPSLKYRFLEQLSLLTDFCRKNKIKYKPNNKLLSQLEKLIHYEDEKDRYFIENQLIESLTLDEITALEYWVCIHEKNESLSLSTARILDWFYSKHWKKIINDDDNLRLYLKKSYLFENIGIEGICNNYLNKFDLSDRDQLSRLQELGDIESDQDILSQILLLLEQEPQEENFTASFEDFLLEPLLFSQRDIKILPQPTLSEMEQVVELIRNIDDDEKVKKLLYFLRLQSDLEYIPALFKLIEDERIVSDNGILKISVADNIIPIVENIYSFKAPVDQSGQPVNTNYWRSLWEKDSVNYEQWGEYFYQLNIDSIRLKDQLYIDEVNNLTVSNLYSEKYKPIILAALKKVRPLKNIRRLNVQPPLSVTEDLKYFEDFVFTYKILDDIPKLFEINNENAGQMLDFMAAKTSTFNYSEKGSFYNNLFRSPWLNNFINARKMTENRIATIKEALKNYLNESSFLSEFEEQTTVLNISKLENIGKPLDAQLNAVFQLNIDQESKAKILEEIIATISYSEISNIVTYFDELNKILGDETFTFFYRDFGLPIFYIKDQKEQEELLNKHQKLSVFAFYKYYLKEFGVDFLDKNDSLDYNKICDILHFDIISPFVSEGGSKRDEYIYGIIRMLEIKFNTRLGFHEKLNEYQTFYTFSSSNRAEAWIGYLQKNNLIDTDKTNPSSFNQARKELKSTVNNSANRK